MTAPALELKQVSKRFIVGGGGWFSRGITEHTAVDRVDLTVPRNKVVALVGESGSGKTTTGLLALRLLAASAGQILLDGQDITTLGPKEMKPFRRQMQVVFQDSYASLDPMMTLGEIIAEVRRAAPPLFARREAWRAANGRPDAASVRPGESVRGSDPMC